MSRAPRRRRGGALRSVELVAPLAAQVPRPTLEALAADPAKLRAVPLSHVVRGNVRAASVAQRPSVRTLGGETLRVRASGGTVRVGAARVTRADVAASNGVSHVVDRVLLP